MVITTRSDLLELGDCDVKCVVTLIIVTQSSRHLDDCKILRVAFIALVFAHQRTFRPPACRHRSVIPENHKYKWRHLRKDGIIRDKSSFRAYVICRSWAPTASLVLLLVHCLSINTTAALRGLFLRKQNVHRRRQIYRFLASDHKKVPLTFYWNTIYDITEHHHGIGKIEIHYHLHALDSSQTLFSSSGQSSGWALVILDCPASVVERRASCVVNNYSVYTQTVTVLIQSSSNLLRMFVLMISQSSSIMGGVG